MARENVLFCSIAKMNAVLLIASAAGRLVLSGWTGAGSILAEVANQALAGRRAGCCSVAPGWHECRTLDSLGFPGGRRGRHVPDAAPRPPARHDRVHHWPTGSMSLPSCNGIARKRHSCSYPWASTPERAYG
jgi:hypothetical protein